jgi:hypothetical protein
MNSLKQDEPVVRNLRRNSSAAQMDEPGANGHAAYGVSRIRLTSVTAITMAAVAADSVRSSSLPFARPLQTTCFGEHTRTGAHGRQRFKEAANRQVS